MKDIFFGIFLMLVIFIPKVASADVVYLSDGTSYEGMVIEETDEHVLLKTDMDVMEIFSEDITRVERKPIGDELYPEGSVEQMPYEKMEYEKQRAEEIRRRPKGTGGEYIEQDMEQSEGQFEEQTGGQNDDTQVLEQPPIEEETPVVNKEEQKIKDEPAVEQSNSENIEVDKNSGSMTIKPVIKGLEKRSYKTY